MLANKIGPIEREIMAGVERGVRGARLVDAAHQAAAPAPRPELNFSFNGVPVHLQPQHATMFGANTHFGHAPQQQQPSRGPAPSDTPKPGK